MGIFLIQCLFSYSVRDTYKLLVERTAEPAARARSQAAAMFVTNFGTPLYSKRRRKKSTAVTIKIKTAYEPQETALSIYGINFYVTFVLYTEIWEKVAERDWILLLHIRNKKKT